jgi:hypothetical protein
MRGALKHNSCPFCSEKIMEDAKAEQYYNLLQVLDNTTFTNRNDVDSKIREKVASLIITNFVFMKIAPPEAKDEIIVVGDTELEASPQPKENAPLFKKTESKRQVQKKSSTGKPMNQTVEQEVPDTEVRSMPSPKAKKLPPQVSAAGLSMKDYLSAQNETYDSADTSYGTESSLTAEEVMKAFPGMTPEEALQALQSDASMLGALNQVATPTKGLTGKGIKRL